MKYKKFVDSITKKHTRRFAFRLFAFSDFNIYNEANLNENFNKFLLTSMSQNKENILEEFKTKEIENNELNTGVTISIVELDTGSWVGFLRCYDFKDKVAASLMIHPKYWGTGSAVEIAKSTTQIFLNDSGFDEVYVRILKENKKTIILNLSMGAELIYTENLLTNDGIIKDCHILKHTKVKDPVLLFDWRKIN